MKPTSNKLRSNNSVNHVIIRAKPGDPTRCLIRFGHTTIQGCLGRNGRTIFKREGDGKTPIANMRVLYGYLKPSIKNSTRHQIIMSQTNQSLGWCDEPTHPSYNRSVKRPFSHSHEKMLRDDILYDFIIVLDWNITCRKRYCGSAIFFHVAKQGYPPTQGCIAVSKRDMMKILPFITKKTRFKVL